MSKKKYFLARNEDNWLCLYDDLPWRDYKRNVWTTFENCIGVIETKLIQFPEITWMEEPVEVEIKIKRKLI